MSPKLRRFQVFICLVNLSIAAAQWNDNLMAALVGTLVWAGWIACIVEVR